MRRFYVAAWLAVLIFSGCMSVDRYSDAFELHDLKNGAANTTKNEIRVGMSQPEIRSICESAGAKIKVVEESTWKVSGQFEFFSPTLDSEELVLYFDKNQKLRAIVTRGSHLVYP